MNKVELGSIKEPGEPLIYPDQIPTNLKIEVPIDGLISGEGANLAEIKYQPPEIRVSRLNKNIEAVTCHPDFQEVEWWNKVAELETRLKDHPRIQRLRDLTQLGVQWFMDDTWRPIGASQDRYVHTQVVSSLVKLSLAKLRSTEEQALAAVTAAWCHDIGHSILSHTGDEILHELGHPDHEARAQHFIKNDDQFLQLAEDLNINVELTSEIMREQGSLGTVQKLMDTAAYLLVDRGEFEDGITIDFATGLIDDFMGINLEEDKLVIQTPLIWQEFLELRAKTMKEYYYNWPNRVNRAAIKELLLNSLQHPHLTGMSVDTIKNGVDADLWNTLGFFESSTERGMTQYSDLYDLSLGNFIEHRWNFEFFPTNPAADHARVRLQPHQMIQSFILCPYDYTKKTIHLQTYEKNQFIDHEIKADKTELAYKDTTYVLGHVV